MPRQLGVLVQIRKTFPSKTSHRRIPRSDADEPE
jgi:hypothetical protein